MFHTDRGKGFDNKLISEALETLGIQQSLSMKGCPYNNAVAEAMFKVQNSLTELISLLLNSSLLNLIVMFIGLITSNSRNTGLFNTSRVQATDLINFVQFSVDIPL